MNNTVKTSDLIEQLGSEFPVEEMEDFEERFKKGEFQGMTREKIISRYHTEAIEKEQYQEHLDTLQAITDSEQ